MPSPAPQHPQLLIFDLDGTLIDSREDLVSCVNATLAHLDRPTLPHDTIAGFIGDGAAALVQRSLEVDGGCDDATAATGLAFFLDYYRQHLLDTTHVYPGVLDTLTAIRSAHPHLHMAVLTNKPVVPSQKICNALGLTAFFFMNVGGNSFGSKKPDPEGLKAIWTEAENRRGEVLTADQIILVGDSEVDVCTARNAGVRSLGCTWGFATAKLLAEKPDLVAHKPGDWLSLLNLTATTESSRA